MRESDGKGNGGCPSDRRRVGQEKLRGVRGRAVGAFRGPREVKSPEDGPHPPRAVVSVVIQEGRVDETKETRQRGRGAEKTGEKGVGCRGMRPWSRYIRAPVPAYTRVFVYLCGTPENPADVREIGRKKEEGGEKQKERENAESERGAFSCEREGRGWREEPMASQGVLPFRYEGASR